MFDIAWGEFVVIAVVALIVIGPKELPAVLRAIGQWTTKIRRMAAEFQGQFQEALREAEMADLKKEVDSLNDTARGFTSQFDDPLNFKEATKWEPKPDDTKPDDIKPDDVKTEFAAESGDALPETTHVASDGHAVAEAAPAAAEHPAPALAAASATADAAASPAAEAPPPATQSVVYPLSPEESGRKGAEGGVHP